MGKISQGILGGFSGKVGNVIGGNWKGIDYMRVRPASVANPQTEGQVDQRTKFSTILQFLQPLTGFLQIGFRSYAIKMTAFNSAMSYNFRNAIIGVYPDYVIDYENYHFGEVNTKINSESIVNMYAYIKGEELLSNLNIELDTCTKAELLDALNILLNA